MIVRIRNYFSRQITEIANDGVLRLYGAAITLCHVFAVMNWMTKEQFVNLSTSGEPLCWPFFESCFQYRFLDPTGVYQMFLIFGIAAAVGVFLFIPKRWVTAAYWWQVGLNVFKILIYVQDFRMRMNQHYMLFFVTLVFLFMPNKRNAIRYLLVFIYFWAGTLKFNYEWISGAALYGNPLFVWGWRVPYACVYVIFLECLFAFGVLSKNRWIFWGALLQLYFFHFVSWQVVGAFYPLLMYFLISIFPLAYFSEWKSPAPSLWHSLIRRQQPFSTYVLLAVFSFMQLIPVLMPGDSKVTCEGRLFALHMFDAKVYCEGQMILKFKDGTTETVAIPLKETFRIRCDPGVNFSRAKWNCWKHRDDPNFLDLDIAYAARLAHETDMRPLVDIENFCSQKLSYDMWRSNDWIKKY